MGVDHGVVQRLERDIECVFLMVMAMAMAIAMAMTMAMIGGLREPIPVHYKKKSKP